MEENTNVNIEEKKSVVKKEKKEKKKSFFKGLKSEFKKIVWPNQETTTKRTVLVVFVAVALGLVIALLDFVIRWGLSFIV